MAVCNRTKRDGTLGIRSLAVRSAANRRAVRQPEGAPRLIELVWADFRALLALPWARSGGAARYLDVLTQPGFLAVVLFRVSVVAHHRGLSPLARLLCFLNHVLFGTDLSPRAVVGRGLALPHPVGTSLGAGVRIGANVVLREGVTLGTADLEDPSQDGFPTVGDGCTIMDGARVLGPVQIGDRAVVGANALVMQSVPAGAIVAAPPGRVIRFREGYAPTTAENGRPEL